MMRLLAIFALVCYGLACQPCSNAADGGGGTIVIGGCAPQISHDSNTQDHLESGNALSSPTVLVPIYLAQNSGFALAAVTAALDQIQSLVTLSVGIDAFIFELASDCSIASERWQLSSQRPYFLSAAVDNTSAIDLIALPQEQWLCSVQLIWAGTQQTEPALVASGQLSNGLDFVIESRLQAQVLQALQPPLWLGANVQPSLYVQLPVAEWLEPLLTASPVSDGVGIRVDAQHNLATLQSIEAKMTQTTKLEVKNEP